MSVRSHHTPSGASSVGELLSVGELSSLEIHPPKVTETEVVEAHPSVGSPKYVSIAVQFCPSRRSARIQARPHCVAVSKFICMTYVSVAWVHLLYNNYSCVQVSTKLKDASAQYDQPFSAPVASKKDASTQCCKLPLPIASSPIAVQSDFELSDIDSQHQTDTSQCTFSPESTLS